MRWVVLDTNGVVLISFWFTLGFVSSAKSLESTNEDAVATFYCIILYLLEIIFLIKYQNGWYLVCIGICKWTRLTSFSFISFLWVGISFGRSNVWVWYLLKDNLLLLQCETSFIYISMFFSFS